MKNKSRLKKVFWHCLCEMLFFMNITFAKRHGLYVVAGIALMNAVAVSHSMEWQHLWVGVLLLSSINVGEVLFFKKRRVVSWNNVFWSLLTLSSLILSIGNAEISQKLLVFIFLNIGVALLIVQRAGRYSTWSETSAFLIMVVLSVLAVDQDALSFPQLLIFTYVQGLYFAFSALVVNYKLNHFNKKVFYSIIFLGMFINTLFWVQFSLMIGVYIFITFKLALLLGVHTYIKSLSLKQLGWLETLAGLVFTTSIISSTIIS